MVNELFGGILLLIQQYGLLAVVIAGLLVIALMFSRTWTKSQDSRTRISDNANKAQELINKRVEALETQNKQQSEDLTEVRNDLDVTKDSLLNARRQVKRLTDKVALLEREKGEIAADRDRLRADLDMANGQIRQLERQVITLQAQLNAEQNAQATTVKPILELLQRVIPPAPVTDTGRLSQSVNADVDPAQPVHIDGTVTIAPVDPAAA